MSEVESFVEISNNKNMYNNIDKRKSDDKSKNLIDSMGEYESGVDPDATDEEVDTDPSSKMLTYMDLGGDEKMDLTSAELNQLLDNMNIGDMLGISDTSAVYEDLAKLVIPKSEEKELKQPTVSYNEKRIDNNKEETNIYSEDIDDDEEGDDVDEEDSSYDRFEVEVSDDLEVSLGEMEMELLVNYIPLKVRSLASASTKYAAKSSSKLGLNAMESSTFSFGLEE